jgi:putative tryptophan/tyrosine transport system substrate-binding protein
LQSAADVLGIRALALNIEIESPQRDIVPAFTAIVEQHAGAILVGSNALVLRPVRDQIISLAARHAIPTMFFDSASTVAGALSSYGPDVPAAFYQAGLYAGRILMGEKPADLPVMQSSKFEFAINLKTAKALGLTIPPNLLALADEVIE